LLEAHQRGEELEEYSAPKIEEPLYSYERIVPRSGGFGRKGL
jgi:hypothetical protein